MVVSFVCSPEQETDLFLKSGPVRKAEGNSPRSSVSKTKGTDPVGHINRRFHGVGMGQYPLSGYVQVGETAVGVVGVIDTSKIELFRNLLVMKRSLFIIDFCIVSIDMKSVLYD